MGNSATEMLVTATLEFLKPYPPFDRMEPEALQFLGERLTLAYYPKDALVISPASGVARKLNIMQRGKLRARQGGDVSLVAFSSLTLGPGECFPIGSVMAQRATTVTYQAIEDVFLYELAADDFFALLQKSAVFNLFCTQYIASLLSQSRQQLQTQFSQHVAEQQTMNSPLSSVIKKEPISVQRDTPIRQVAEQMVELKIGSMIVVDDEKKPVGIFTLSDVLKRIVLSGIALDKPIHEVMSPTPYTLPLAANAYDAALAMAMNGVRHVLAVDEGGRLKGVVSERDLFALQRVGLRQIRQSIDTANDIEMLVQASHDVRQLSLNMLAQGVGAEQLTQFISALNDTLTRRIIELNLERHDLVGIEWAWLAFGSEGRDEQTLSTDQDNGIVYVCTDIMDREQTQLRFLEFARDVNADLDCCGFPLCRGNIMASNPELCLTLEEWEERFVKWVRTPEPEALLNASIFFDFRPLFGKYNLADRLRLSLFKLTNETPLFLRMMAENALGVQPPLGMIRDFVTDLDDEYPGTIDLKVYGARLFVDAARIFSLRYKLSATSTVQRLRMAATQMNLSVDDIGACIEGFNFIQLLRLRSQCFETNANVTEKNAEKNAEKNTAAQRYEGSNRVNPDDLNEVERRILKEAFKQARRLQQRLKLDYQL